MTEKRWRTWSEIRAEAIAAGRVSEDGLAAGAARLRAAQRAYRLAEIRKELGLRQREVADAMEVSQRRVSALERGDMRRSELGTIEAYVSALGGRVEIVADFGDERVVVGDSDDPELADASAESGEAPAPAPQTVAVKSAAKTPKEKTPAQRYGVIPSIRDEVSDGGSRSGRNRAKKATAARVTTPKTAAKSTRRSAKKSMAKKPTAAQAAAKKTKTAKGAAKTNAARSHKTTAKKSVSIRE